MPADRLPPGRSTRPYPLLAAGLVACLACGQRGCAIDADGITDELILATFTPPCEHAAQPRTMIVTPSELEPFDPETYEP